MVIYPEEASLCWLKLCVDPEKEGETEKAPSSEKAHRFRNDSRGHGRDVEDRGGGAEGYRLPGMCASSPGEQ